MKWNLLSRLETRMTRMIRVPSYMAAVVAVLFFAADAVGGGGAVLWREFVDPPTQSRPWCYWWWINGHVDRPTITADLEAIRRLGFGGVLMFDSRGYRDDEEHVINPKAELEWGSEEWQELVAFSIRECARLGIRFTMNASASGGTLNGFRDGKEYEVDITDRREVAGHLDDAIGPVLGRVPGLVGNVFTHLYSVSYEGNIKQGASWSAIKDSFYAEMAQWAHRHGLKVYSESGGPWFWGAVAAKLDCDQLDMLAHNDMPQGEFWPHERSSANPNCGHANRNGRFFMRAPVLSARRNGRNLVSMEAFTHMQRHYSVDPAFLKPLADIAFADGVNHLVWHTFTCSPKRFGVPGAEYFAGSHINRNVTWHKDAAAFVGYLGRCQALLQRGVPVDDGEFVDVSTNYYGWGRFRKNEKAQFTTTHRREWDVDFFFVVGEGKGDVVLNASCEGRSVEIWDAVTCRACRPATAVCANGKTQVFLDLPVGGSCFVVFAQEGAEGNSRVERVERVEVDIANAWQVSFAYHDGISATPPAPVVMDALRDWTAYGEDGKADSTSLRYFSGAASYKTTVQISPTLNSQFSTLSTRLSLGSLPSGLAHVFVNDVDCGVVWCAPWEADISSALREGENEIEIRYTNNWYNRLVGDCFLPEGERVTRSTLRYWQVRRGRTDPKRSGKTLPTNCSGPSMFDELQPSGLLGPVRLTAAETLSTDKCNRR